MISSFEGHSPSIASTTFIAKNATVIGEVEIADSASVWYGCVLRGDVGSIRVGPRTNIQDLSVVHVTGGKHNTTIGADVTVGHRVVVHGCTVGDRVLVGMGAVLLDGVVVESDCIIGAGALVTPGAHVPRGSLVLGAPAKVVRSLTESEIAGIAASAARYVDLSARHRRPESD